MKNNNEVCPLMMNEYGAAFSEGAGFGTCECAYEECALFVHELDACAFAAIASTLEDMEARRHRAGGISTGRTCPLKGGAVCDGSSCAFAIELRPKELNEVLEEDGGRELRTTTTRTWVCGATDERPTVATLSTEERRPYDGTMVPMPAPAPELIEY